MKLTGYYMTSVSKFADGIKTIIVFGVRNREELVKALSAAHPDEKFSCTISAAKKFSLEMAVNESTDPGYLADRLDIPQVDEVM